MWTHKCNAKTRKGKPCRNYAKWAILTRQFNDEKYDNPTWVELCGHPDHITQAAYIASLETGSRNAKH